MKTATSPTGDVAKGAIISGIAAIAVFFVNYNLDYAGIGGTSIFGGSPGFLLFLQGIILAVIFIVGALIGLILSLLIILITNIFKISYPYKSLLIILVSPLVIITTFFYLKLPDIQSRLHSNNERRDIQNNPQALNVLIAKAKKDPASVDTIEKTFIWQSVQQKNPTVQEELPFLLEFFKNETVGTCGLMEHNKLSENQIRFIYSNFKQTQGGWIRIYDEIISNDNTPPDILNDIIVDIENARGTTFDYMLENAKTALAKKQIN